MFVVVVCRMIVLCCVYVEEIVVCRCFPLVEDDVCILYLQTITLSFVSISFLWSCLMCHFAQLRARSFKLNVRCLFVLCVCGCLCDITYTLFVFVFCLWFCRITVLWCLLLKKCCSSLCFVLVNMMFVFLFCKQ